MRKFFFFIASVVAAFILDRILTPTLGLPIPFFFLLFFLLCWFANLSRPTRLYLGVVFGIFMDSFSLLPFGTYTIILFFIAYMPEIISPFLANARPLIRQGMIDILLVILFFLLLYPISKVLVLII